MRKFLVAVGAVMMALVPMGFFAGVASAHHSEGHENNRPCENWPANHPVFDAHPLCIDGVFTPPGHTDDPQCNNPGQNPNCDDGNGGDPDPATCPPGTGPVSGVVQQVSDGFRDGGGAPIADVIDTVNCEIIVGVLGL